MSPSARPLVTLASPSTPSRTAITSSLMAASCSGSPERTREKLAKALEVRVPPDTETYSAPNTCSAFCRTMVVSSSIRFPSSTRMRMLARLWSTPPRPRMRDAMASMLPPAPISHCLVPMPSTPSRLASNWDTNSAVSTMVTPLGRSTSTEI